jgi:hypothetical protein
MKRTRPVLGCCGNHQLLELMRHSVDTLLKFSADLAAIGRGA